MIITCSQPLLPTDWPTPFQPVVTPRSLLIGHVQQPIGSHVCVSSVVGHFLRWQWMCGWLESLLGICRCLKHEKPLNKTLRSYVKLLM